MTQAARPGNELSLDLPANHAAVMLARRVVRHFARLGGVSQGNLEVLLLVLSELLGNVVDHGGGEGALGPEDGAAIAAASEGEVRMLMTLVLHEAGWTFRVSDQGGGDPEEVRRLIAPEGMPDLEDERGRGFFLIAQMVDRLDVEKSADERGLTFIAERAEARA